MTLDQFVAQRSIRNLYVKHKGWKTLYVRHATHIVGGEVRETFDLANIEAGAKGKGRFKALISYLREIQSAPIYVESVLSPRLAEGLLRMGFTQTGENNFYLLPENSYSQQG